MVQGRGSTRDRLTEPHFDKTYREKRKLPEPTVCQDCGAVYTKGRWSWGSAPENAHRALCPACIRMHDNDPAGYIGLDGPFMREHRDEITSLARHIETREMADHPHKRIMAIKVGDDGDLLITTTDTHLAWSIGEAIEHAYHGELNHRVAENPKVLHVTWTR